MPCTIYLAGFNQWAVSDPGDGNDITDILLVFVEYLVICSSQNFNVSFVIMKS